MSETRITHLLYMEDDPSLSLLLKKRFERRGYRVDIAADGEEGLRMAGASQYDVLLVDYNMPYCGGIDVIRALASKGKLTPTIMVTGEGNEEVAVEALKLGAADYVVKDMELKYLELLPVIVDQVLYKQQLINESRRMEEAVRESEERYRKLVDLSPDGISIHVDGRFVFINPAGARMLGAAHPDQLVGISTLDVVHPDCKERVRLLIRQLGEKVYLAPWIEEQYIRLDGSPIDVEVCGVNFVHKGAPAIQMIFKDITERKLVEQRFEHLALYDALTGLPNRMLFFDRTNQLLAFASRNSYILSLLYMDLDNFKYINDTFGHEVGDLVLAEVSKRMTSSMRNSDTVARMGGHEFIGICARIASSVDAAVIAKKIIAVLARPLRIGDLELTVSVSVGISLYPLDGDDVETLMRKADDAMYKVKKSAKGGFRFFSDVAGSSSVSVP
jgi:diguanylate cyclase (GGDEF)-like protein/PAS domain S-box-containing protein